MAENEVFRRRCASFCALKGCRCVGAVRELGAKQSPYFGAQCVYAFLLRNDKMIVIIMKQDLEEKGSRVGEQRSA